MTDGVGFQLVKDITKNTGPFTMCHGSIQSIEHIHQLAMLVVYLHDTGIERGIPLHEHLSAMI